MTALLFLLLLITGLVPLVQPITRTFYLIQQAKTWSDARAYCQANYLDLANTETASDLVQLQTVAPTVGFTGEAWIGASLDLTRWYWSHLNESLGAFTFWGSGEPNNNGGDQECVAIRSDGWFDRPCSDTCPFVCYDEQNIGTSRYIFYSDYLTWSEALGYCRLHHTDLATAKDATENADVGGLTTDNTWFGLWRLGWKWTDVNNVFPVPWASGQPDNYDFDENCAYLYNDLVEDGQCTALKDFYCYQILPVTPAPFVYTAKIQMLKLKFISAYNMSDPAVKVDILGKIQQKLQQHGLVGITLKYKKRPDGVVFQIL